jgi:hypothetical protein
MNHAKYTLLQDNRLFLAPLPPDPQHILDVGTGTGTCPSHKFETCSHARHLRHRDRREVPVSHSYRNRHRCHASYMVTVTFYETFDSHISRVPPNCTFELDDAESDWPYKPNLFDYIHGRDLYHSIRDWPRLVQQAYR